MRRRRGQALVEFAVVAPLLFLFVFGIIDFGRATYAYSALSGAVSEGARRASVGGSADFPPPSNAEVLAAVQARTPGLMLAFPSCPNQPLTADPAPDSGYLTISGGGGTANAPGGQTSAPGGCPAIVPAGGATTHNQPLTVSGRFRVRLVTPLVSNLVGGSVLLRASATHVTDY